MTVKLELNISNQAVYLFIAIVLVLGLFVTVNAYSQPIPTPGHAADRILVSIRGEEKTLQEGIDDDDFFQSLVCVTVKRTKNSALTFLGSNDGNTYSADDVAEIDSAIGIKCKNESNWIMTGCSSGVSGSDEDEGMDANLCIGDANSYGTNYIRCCKLF